MSETGKSNKIKLEKLVHNEAGGLVPLANWADESFFMYKGNQTFSAYYARDKRNTDFYMLSPIGKEYCKKLSYTEFLQMSLEKTLEEISAKDIGDPLLSIFQEYISEQIAK